MAMAAQTAVPFDNPPKASNDNAVAPTFTQVLTDLDIHGLLSKSLSCAEGQDGAEGHPLVFDLSELHESLDSSISSTSTVASGSSGLSFASSPAIPNNDGTFTFRAERLTSPPVPTHAAGSYLSASSSPFSPQSGADIPPSTKSRSRIKSRSTTRPPIGFPPSTSSPPSDRFPPSTQSPPSAGFPLSTTATNPLLSSSSLPSTNPRSSTNARPSTNSRPSNGFTPSAQSPLFTDFPLSANPRSSTNPPPSSVLRPSTNPPPSINPQPSTNRPPSISGHLIVRDEPANVPLKRPGEDAVEGKPLKKRKQSDAQVARKKAQSKDRSVTRRREIARALANGRVPNFYRTPQASTAVYLPPPQIIQTEINPRDLPVTRHCWSGIPLAEGRSTAWKLDELLQEGFKVIHWDRRAPLVITDKDRRVIAVFVGPPLGTNSSEWDDVARNAVKTLSNVRKAGLASGVFPQDMQKHRRGSFVALAVGVSHGNGRQHPGNLYHPHGRMSLVKDILSDPSIQRFAGYQSSIFSFFAPRIYRHYCHNLSHLFERQPSLQRNFANSVFPAASFNLGPATVAVDHTDASNVGYGLCALTALGSFDARKGGHLVLFDLGLMVEFSNGDVGILPSGILRHGNTAIQDGEERYSIAQYCAGGLLQYIDYGYTTAAAAMRGKSKTKSKEIKAALDGNHEERVQRALDMFSVVDELDADRKSVFKGFASFVKSEGTSS